LLFKSVPQGLSVSFRCLMLNRAACNYSFMTDGFRRRLKPNVRCHVEVT
jgi:hypothetical protein